MTWYESPWTQDAPPVGPPSRGRTGPVPAGDPTAWVPRTLLVSGAGGLAVGAATGTLPFPLVGTAVGALVGGALGLLAGLLTVAVVAATLRRRPHVSSGAARALFAAQTVVVAGACAAVSVWLLYAELRQPTGFAYDRLMILTFAVPGPLALTLVLAAAPWCLGGRVPGLRRPHAGRRVWCAAIPVLVVLVLAAPVSLYVFS